MTMPVDGPLMVRLALELTKSGPGTKGMVGFITIGATILGSKVTVTQRPAMLAWLMASARLPVPEATAVVTTKFCGTETLHVAVLVLVLPAESVAVTVSVNEPREVVLIVAPLEMAVLPTAPVQPLIVLPELGVQVNVNVAASLRLY